MASAKSASSGKPALLATMSRAAFCFQRSLVEQMTSLACFMLACSKALIASGKLCLARRFSVKNSTIKEPSKKIAMSISNAKMIMAGTMRALANWRKISCRYWVMLMRHVSF